MKQIKETWNVNELLETVGMKLPVELPEFGFSFEYKDGIAQLKVHYDEQMEKIDMSENELKAWLLQLQAMVLLCGDDLKKAFDGIISEVS